jgi:hypothetical protein
MVTKLHVSRRRFLGLGGVGGLAALPLLNQVLPVRSAAAAEGPGFGETPSCTDLNAAREPYWHDNGTYFVQENVDVSQLADGVIRARIDGRWQGFQVRELTRAFQDWNFAKREAMLNIMMTGQYDLYNDIHNAAVASYGANRGDSRLSLNVAYKGTGWVPVPSMIKDKIKQYQDTCASGDMTKFQILQANYDHKEWWRRDVLGSHDLYTTVDYESHTFLNQMVNPVSTLCFLDMISYEIRAIVRLLHPDDPGLTEEEHDLVTWVNYAHDWFHGGASYCPLTATRIVALYYVIELFDNSPWGQTPSAGGHRLVPMM